MNLRFTSGFAALGCVLLASCYPYNENMNRQHPQNQGQKPATAADQQKIKEQRDKLKEKQDSKPKDEVKNETPGTTETTGQTGETPKPPTEEKRADYKFANKVPGKDGFVFSPYNNKVVDVRDIPSGTLVQDPTYTGAGKGYFRVP